MGKDFIISGSVLKTNLAGRANVTQDLLHCIAYQVEWPYVATVNIPAHYYQIAHMLPSSPCLLWTGVSGGGKIAITGTVYILDYTS